MWSTVYILTRSVLPASADRAPAVSPPSEPAAARALPTLRASARRLRVCANRQREDPRVRAPGGRGEAAFLISVQVLMLMRWAFAPQVLSARLVTRLRALVVLPTRDLVSQVRETFDAVAKGRGLKVRRRLMDLHMKLNLRGFYVSHNLDRLGHGPALLRTRTGTAGRGPDPPVSYLRTTPRSHHNMRCRGSLQGGSSSVDILVCTPGRLIDHLHGTPNFSLQHLRFLVRHLRLPIMPRLPPMAVLHDVFLLIYSIFAGTDH